MQLQIAQVRQPWTMWRGGRACSPHEDVGRIQGDTLGITAATRTGPRLALLSVGEATFFWYAIILMLLVFTNNFIYSPQVLGVRGSIAKLTLDLLC